MSHRQVVQFYSRYTNYYFSKLVIDMTHRHTYEHWNNWCFRGGNGKMCFDKGYDEDYAKREIRKYD